MADKDAVSWCSHCCLLNASIQFREYFRGSRRNRQPLVITHKSARQPLEGIAQIQLCRQRNSDPKIWVITSHILLINLYLIRYTKLIFVLLKCKSTMR